MDTFPQKSSTYSCSRGTVPGDRSGQRHRIDGRRRCSTVSVLSWPSGGDERPGAISMIRRTSHGDAKRKAISYEGGAAADRGRTIEPGASVSRVARAHDVNANQLFHWRRQYRAGWFEEEKKSTALLPVRITAAVTRKQGAVALGGGNRQVIFNSGK